MVLLLLSGIIAGILAIKLGKFRSFCIYMSLCPFGRASLPLGWYHSWFRILTWILVTILSIWSAGIVSIFIAKNTNSLLGYLAFGALLILRWQVSSVLAVKKIKTEYPEVHKWLNF